MSDAVELHVETAPFPQTIECPQCDAEMRFLIESTDIGGTRCEECGVDIIYVHDRRGETTSEDTEQQTLVTDGGEDLAYGGVCPVCDEEFEDGFDRLDEDESYDVKLCVVEKDGEDAEALFHLPEVSET